MVWPAVQDLVLLQLINAPEYKRFNMCIGLANALQSEGVNEDSWAELELGPARVVLHTRSNKWLQVVVDMILSLPPRDWQRYADMLKKAATDLVAPV
ncbi:hypothetical protein AMAG_14306 [Allomyces macrogynus ATCC 38327]|uniref:Uncharacterized protein n=1 Tax=Allomyces macrogynus (strain ATCC 38327) TaxID=578462 RepID=A0A0L0T4U8_ALLM3|nr:hypothetical protein AMAG_14306 [Allomyces macrogynus ATCC 38327]|eukprot:KNE69767.1 hypothetical protein AMAG_14306 [Allomyces macrogynus ATCC 38327]